MAHQIAQLSSQDAQFLYLEADGHLTHATGVTIYDPSTRADKKPPRFTEIIDHVAQRSRYEPLVRQKLVRLPFDLDYPYWTEDEFFDIEAHIVHVRLPEPGDWRQLCIHLARYHSRPLNMHRPLWEMLVIEGLNNVEGVPAGSYAIATKIHHAAADGASMMRFFMRVLDVDAEGTPVMPEETLKLDVGKLPSAGQIGLRAMSSTLRSPLRTAESVLKVAPKIYNSMQERLRDKAGFERNVPRSRFNARVSQHKMFDAVELDLATVKKIRKLVDGATVNDVALCICSGALNRYLEHHDDMPDDSLISMCPMNLRAKDGSDAAITGNNITAMAIPIYTNVEDPVERLQAIQYETYTNKTAKSATPAQLLTDLTRHVPAVTQVMASRLVLQLGIASKMVNLFVSNVPGPPVDLYMNGARQVSNYALAPLGEGCGLFIGITSYRDRISFNVTSTREIMPDIAFYVQCLEAAYDELAALV